VAVWKLEIRCRIGNLLTSTDFDLSLRIRFVQCYAWTVLLYGMEGWTLKVNIIEGKRGIDRKKLSSLRNVRQWTGLKTIQ